jgi:hypothetical protein
LFPHLPSLLPRCLPISISSSQAIFFSPQFLLSPAGIICPLA